MEKITITDYKDILETKDRTLKRIFVLDQPVMYSPLLYRARKTVDLYQLPVFFNTLKKKNIKIEIADNFVVKKKLIEWKNLLEKRQSSVRLYYPSEHMLYPFQEEGVRVILYAFEHRQRIIDGRHVGLTKGYLLADAMGLGKTIQAITVLNTVYMMRKKGQRAAQDGTLGKKMFLYLPGNDEYEKCHFLVVSPAHMVHEWKEYMQEWLVEELRDKVITIYDKNWRELWNEAKQMNQPAILIVSYTSLFKFITGGLAIKELNEAKTTFEKFERINSLRDFDFARVSFAVWDEAHEMRNYDTRKSIAAFYTPADFNLLLTGTPYVNKTSELFVLLYKMYPEMFFVKDYFSPKYKEIAHSYRLFEYLFAEFENKKIYYAKNKSRIVRTYKRAKNEESLKLILHQALLRRTAENAKGMPEYIRIFKWIKLSDEITRNYNNVLRQILKLNKSRPTEMQDEEMQDEEVEHIAKILIKIGKLKVPYLIEHVKQYFLQQVRKPAPARANLVIFTKYLEVTDLVVEEVKKVLKDINKELLGDVWQQLGKKQREKIVQGDFEHVPSWFDVNKYKNLLFPVKVEKITGSTSQKKKKEIAHEFRNNQITVLVATIKAASTGLNFDNTDTAFFLEWDFTAANNVQAEGRIRRLSSKHKHVKYVYFAISNSLDKHILNLVERKAQEAANLLQEKQKWTHIQNFSQSSEEFVRKKSNPEADY